ncbi:DUF2278 family protein [Mycolicibacterium brisbanense]|uniref:DUF2278 family protein n=1 Tax=Mycolicibacterium brisbanense TaxID=146020 RepID=A0A117I650_9MYCO|nr:DUF2278 family protein [Mycolicibacterium brisbanense]MCV7155880.1 DUF2278 family protein [Mycolicibacterium brisbanense]GAS89492.1 uncharacterized protein RMCB_3588 [Mycolicibacterium brisbanense]
MALPAYGVLIGTLDHFTREDPNHFGSWYHGKIWVNAHLGLYECAVDVSTPNGVPVQYREVRNLDKRLFAFGSDADDWYPLARSEQSGALDYLRSPLLRGRAGCVGFVASPLIDLANAILRSPRFGWVESTADNALNLLEERLSHSRRLYVFGRPYTNGLGVHDIHMNQGDPPGQFQGQDGIWQDGGTIIESKDGTLNAFLTKFKTQSLQTDDNGLPV